jgi:hypothetical protein
VGGLGCYKLVHRQPRARALLVITESARAQGARRVLRVVNGLQGWHGWHDGLETACAGGCLHGGAVTRPEQQRRRSADGDPGPRTDVGYAIGSRSLRAPPLRLRRYTAWREHRRGGAPAPRAARRCGAGGGGAGGVCVDKVRELVLREAVVGLRLVCDTTPLTTAAPCRWLIVGCACNGGEVCEVCEVCASACG